MGQIQPAFASATPNPTDLYLSHTIQVDPKTGEFVPDSDGRIQEAQGSAGLLVRWDEIEYLELTKLGGDDAAADAGPPSV
jgi:hypothetical protein